MNMTDKKNFYIDGRECICYATEQDADILLVQPVDEHDMEDMDNELEAIRSSTAVPFQMVAVKVDDWQKDLTPWESPAVFGKVPFGNRAPEMLHFITEKLLPTLTYKRVLLGGYSLAGLFALWASYNTDVFHG